MNRNADQHLQTAQAKECIAQQMAAKAQYALHSFHLNA
jgi:hypothetical protein